MSYSYTFKYVTVGNSGSGKSSIALMFTGGTYNYMHNLTIGVEFVSKIVTIPNTNIKCQLQLWDTAGQESFRSITRSYYRGSAVAIIVYDITNRVSFTQINTWIKDVKETSKDTHVIVIVGNKCDLSHKREVSTLEGKKFASKHGFLFFETSAKTGVNIDKLFETSANMIYQKILSNVINQEDHKNFGVKISKPIDTYMSNNIWDTINDNTSMYKKNCCRI